MSIDFSGSDAADIKKINDEDGRIFINSIMSRQVNNTMTSTVAPFIFTIRFDHTMKNFPEGSFKLDFKVNGTDDPDLNGYLKVYVSKSDVRELGSYTLDG